MFIKEEITFCLEFERSLDWGTGLRIEKKNSLHTLQIQFRTQLLIENDIVS